MDDKTCRVVLNKILEMTPKTRIVHLHLDKIEEIFKMPSKHVQSAIDILCQQGKIEANLWKTEIKVTVLPNAFGDEIRQEDITKNERKNKFFDRSWDIVQLLIGFIFGLLIEFIAFMFFKSPN